MNISRRTMISGTAGLISGTILLPGALLASSDDPVNPELFPKEIMFSALSNAMDAAKAAGAEHVEISMTRIIVQTLSQTMQDVSRIRMTNHATIGIGVRALIGGRWGHAATNQFEMSELVRIAKAACSQARANSRHRMKKMEWMPSPNTVADYITPGIDPFSVTQEEKIDFINSWRTAVLDFSDSKYEGMLYDCSLHNARTERAFVNSAGSRLYSIVYGIQGIFPVLGRIKGAQSLMAPQPKTVRGMDSQQGGWEVFRESNAHLQIPKLVIESAEESMIGSSPVDIGRYEVVCDPQTVGSIITNTIVPAAEIDRAIGLEANAGGTSYLGPDISEHLGSVVGHENLNISINRTAKGGLATIPWDAEGVSAKSFSLVKGGKLMDYLTNREYAPLLNEWYSKNGREPGSNACSYASAGVSLPIVGWPNIRIEPGSEQIGMDDMIRDVKKGFLLSKMYALTSFQRKDGYINGLGREITNGKLGSFVQVGVLFSATEFLNSMTAIGGEKSVSYTGTETVKSQPGQRFYCSIESVPMRFSNVTIIDPSRKI